MTRSVLIAIVSGAVFSLLSIVSADPVLAQQCVECYDDTPGCPGHAHETVGWIDRSGHGGQPHDSATADKLSAMERAAS